MRCMWDDKLINYVLNICERRYSSVYIFLRKKRVNFNETNIGFIPENIWTDIIGYNIVW